MMLTNKGMARERRNEDLMGLLLRLRSLGINAKSLLTAIEATPRDRYVPVQFADNPWYRRSLPIECGQIMTGVDQVVRTVHAMGLSSSHSVLEIGTGTGYQTALIARLVKKVVSIDRFKILVEQAKQHIETDGITNAVIVQRDGVGDISDIGLYDRIVANGVFQSLPKQYLDHIASGGNMVTAIGDAVGEQMLVRLTKVGSRFEREDLFGVRMSPLATGLPRYL